MKVCVTGGRNYWGQIRVYEVLSEIHATHDGISVIVHGDCRDILTGEPCGADRWANEWALDHRTQIAAYAANWKKLGRSAGPLRNKFMLTMERPDLVVAFPGGHGTASCVGIARGLGIEVREVRK